jgi:hypothetical protein
MIRLVCDPYRVSRFEGSRVRTLTDELAAFRLIADTLQNDDRNGTVSPLGNPTGNLNDWIQINGYTPEKCTQFWVRK